ncbi:hypothetical protein ACQP2P_38635 [Dactylosporangium sp. CA-139114]|uniref:hypothetical protein n=1 Tax=Dactylosporangium sp. CA-139114 TaxID=3239931 RepID=UPI003D992A75
MLRESEDAMARAGDARRAADALALALEEAGFDVGREFPLLQATVSRDGTPTVEVGHLVPVVAERLADLIARAASSDVTVEGLPD